MRYYSTNKIAPSVGLNDAVIDGLAPDRGLYMPNKIPRLSIEFFENIQSMNLQEISFAVADALWLR